MARHDFTHAIELLSSAVSTFRKDNDTEFEIRALSLLGCVYFSRGDFLSSEKILAESYEKTKKLKESSFHANGVANKSGTLKQDRERRSPSLYFDLASSTLMSLANARANQGKWKEAEDDYQTCLGICSGWPTYKGRHRKGMVLRHLADGQVRYSDNLDSALENYQKAEDIFSSIDDKNELIFCFSYKGQIYQYMGQLEEASSWCNRALQLIDPKTTPKEQISVANAHFAQVCYELGRDELALSSAERACEINRKIDQNQGLSRDLLLLGHLLRRKECYDEAFTHYIEALEIATTNNDSKALLLIVKGIAEITILCGDIKRGYQILKEDALPIAKKLNDTELIASIEHSCVAIEDPQHIASTLQQQIDAIKGKKNHVRFEQILERKLGEHHYRNGRFALARNHLHNSVLLLEQIRTTFHSEEFIYSFSEQHVAIYHLMVRLCLADGDLETAYEYAENGRSRALSVFILNELKSYYSHFRDQELEQYRHIVGQVIYLAREMTEHEKNGWNPANSIIERYAQKKLEEQQYLFSVQRNYYETGHFETNKGPHWRILQENLESLSDAVVVLSFCVLEDETVVFCHSKQHFKHATIPIKKCKLHSTILHFLHSFGAAESNIDGTDSESINISYLDYSQNLFDVLLRPFINVIDESAHLCIIPHGALHALPFHALHDGKQFLIETVAVSYSPNSTVLGTCLQKQVTPPRKIVALGNPAPTNFSNLEGAEKEVGGLEKVAGDIVVDVQTREKATRDYLLNSADADVWHIAAHADFVRDVPHLSYVQLSAQTDDGRLYAYEIAKHEKVPPIVVASGCMTARTKENLADELNGLLYSFLAAGAYTVVGSLWSVSDDSTCKLMSYFYEDIIQNCDFNLAVSLQRAQLKLLRDEKTENPAHWAPFSLYGAWKNFKK